MNSRLEKKYRKMIEELYPNELEYISYEQSEKNSHRYKYSVTTKCVLCGVIRKASADTYRKGTKCRCLKGKNLEVAAKQYAKELYMGINSDKLGVLFGKELDEYVRASVLYDRPTLYNFDIFLETVREYIYDYYMKDEVTACRKCHIALPKRNMGKDKKHCKECYEEIRRERGLYVRIG